MTNKNEGKIVVFLIILVALLFIASLLCSLLGDIKEGFDHCADKYGKEYCIMMMN